MTALSHSERHALAIEKLPNGETAGRDPLEMPITIMEQIGHSQMPLLKVLRAKCLDCSHTAYEVARCTAFDCPLWPYRLGKNPMRAERTEAQKAADAIRADRLRNSRKAANESV
jgi:hypothetical protein